MLKAKFKAALIHGSVTVLVAVVTAGVVYGLWYPGAFAEMTHGTSLFKLLLSVEIVLGPVMSLVIYNTSKPKSELFRDYCVIGGLQLSALIYGLHSVYVSRPVYLVFVKDRIEVVSATELAESDLEQAEAYFRTLPVLGPQLICVESPTDPKEKSDLLTSALNGKDIQLIPKYYRECRDAEIEIKTYKKEQLSSLAKINSDDLPGRLAKTHFTWLPVVTRFGYWTVFYENGHILHPIYLNIDPFNPLDNVPQGDGAPVH